MSITIRELIDALTEYAEVEGDEIEVRLMMQPSWPFEYSIDGITDSENLDFVPKAGRNGWEDEDSDQPVVYLTEGRQLGYGTKDAWC